MALDLLRGLAMAVLVVNHVHLDSALELATQPFLSAAETLVLVSGVVVGMVLGRRWRVRGAAVTAWALLRRAGVLYRATVCLAALVALATVVPGLPTEALTVAPRTTTDLYAFDGLPRLALAVVALQAGPWQVDVLGFFILALALAPAVLWALDRRLWPVLVLLSWALYVAGRATGAAVLPIQSEGPFPLLVWQLLFVHGAVLGWHRSRVEAVLRPHARLVVGVVVAAAAAAAILRLHELGLDLPFGGPGWDAEHFSKRLLDPGRLASMVAFAAFACLVLRRWSALVERVAGRVLLPLGRCSFYVFLLHVPLCLAVATVLPGDGLGLAGNTVLQLGCVVALSELARRRVLFRWVPR